MALISLLTRLVNGVQRQVDLSTNTLVVQELKLNGTLLTTSAGSGAIGDAGGYTNFTPTGATVRGALQGIDSALAGSGSTQFDGTFKIENSSDHTKILVFDASGIATATTRTIIMPNSNVNLGLVATAIQSNGSVAFAANQPMGGFKLTGLAAGSTAGDSVRYEQAILISGVNAWTANQSLGGFLITNSGTPLASGDLANKGYVDNIAQGLNWKQTARSATTAALPANTYNNGTSGVGATLTGNANGALPAQDGVTLVVNDRLLVKNEATSANNGIYVVTQVGSGGTPYILTRSSDANTNTSLQWATLEISPDASTQAGYIYREANDIATIGTSAVAFSLVSHGLDWVFGNGLLTVGNNVSVQASDSSILSAAGGISVVNDAAGAIVTGGSGIKIQLESSNPTLQIVANALGVKLDGSRAITTGASGIGVNVDNSSIEINTNAVRIKTTAYDQVTITGGGGSAAQVAQAPVVAWTETAGQSFSANVTVAVRYGLVSNGETAGRIYAADITTSSFDLFNVIGFIQPTGAISAGNSVSVIGEGSLTLLSGDTNFASSDTGKALFLQANGVQATTTAPSTSGQAVLKIGVVKTTTSFRVQIGSAYVA